MWTFWPASKQSETSLQNALRLAALLLMILGIWLSSGTLAPYAATLSAPRVLLPCGYLGNIDHDHFRATFLMLDGAPRESWAFSVVLRRILFPLLAYPMMKMVGFEWGGFLTSLLLHAVAFWVFTRFLVQRYGARAGTLGAWLLATYPGIYYWAGLPYSYASIVPSCLMAAMLLFRLQDGAQTARSWRFVLWPSLGLGVLFTAYDLFPFFGISALWVLISARRFRPVFPALAAMIAPQALSTLLLVSVYHVPVINSNTAVYNVIAQAFLHTPDWSEWAKYWFVFHKIAVHNFLFSGFLFLPLLFGAALGLDLVGPRLRLEPVEAAILFAVALGFSINNLAPPYEGWQMRGAYIPRLYQPVFVVYILFLTRKLRHLDDETSAWRRPFAAACTIVIVASASVSFGGILGNPLGEKLFFRFYQQSDPAAMRLNLERFGRRPLGFCRDIEAKD